MNITKRFKLTSLQWVVTIVSVVLALGIIGGALVYRHMQQPKFTVRSQHPVTKTELAAADGKNGHDCFVAVDNTVYQIADNEYWQNGQHKPSKGLAYCGADMTKQIDKSPHGRKVLQTLPIVGPMQ